MEFSHTRIILIFYWIDIVTLFKSGSYFIQALDGFLFMLNGTGDFQYVSPNVHQYIRFDVDELLRSSIYNFLDSSDHLKFKKYFLDFGMYNNPHVCQ